LFLWNKLFETRHNCSPALRQIFASRSFDTSSSKVSGAGVKIRVIGDPRDAVTKTLFEFVKEIQHNADDFITLVDDYEGEWPLQTSAHLNSIRASSAPELNSRIPRVMSSSKRPYCFTLAGIVRTCLLI
jgi:hypothetical protein